MYIEREKVERLYEEMSEVLRSFDDGRLSQYDLFDYMYDLRSDLRLFLHGCKTVGKQSYATLLSEMSNHTEQVAKTGDFTKAERYRYLGEAYAFRLVADILENETMYKSFCDTYLKKRS